MAPRRPVRRPDSRNSVSSSANISALISTSRPSSVAESTSSKRHINDNGISIRQKRLRFQLDTASTVSNVSRPSTGDSKPSTSAETASVASEFRPSRRQVNIEASGRLGTASSTASTSHTSRAGSIASSYSRATASPAPTAVQINARPYATTIARTQTHPRTSTTSRPQTRARTATTYLNTGASSEQAIVCAVTESRGVSPTVGLACVNLTTFQASLCQIVDGQMYVRTLQKLFTWAPNTVLYPSTLADSRLMMFLEADLHANVELTSIDKRYFTENDGRDHMQQLALTDEVEPLKVAVDGKFYALCALSGVLEYLKHDGEYSFAPSSLRICLEPSDGSMMIDLSTIHSLELTQNLHHGKSRDCLFGLLNETLTPMGARLLRSWVLQPSTQDEVLERRYEALEELTRHENIFVGVRNALKRFVDVDKVLTNIVILPNEKNLVAWQDACINYVLILKEFVQRIAPIFESLARAECELLVQIAESCGPEVYSHILEMIDDTINADTCFSRKPLELKNQKLYAVKSGASDLLDVARTAHKETVEDVMKHCRELAESHELSLELSFDNKRSYFMKFPSHELEGKSLDEEIFINVCKNKKFVECQTMNLLKLNDKLASSNSEVLLMSAGAIHELVQRIRAEVGPLFKISDSIAVLDVLAALAQVATQHDYVRPRIASTTAIKAARHPIKIKISQTRFVPNEVYAPNNARFQILTGCNMSGKSTYIRTVALLQVMAQVGSFVPAEHAEFSIRDQLFARVSTDDNISANVSTFAAEMREAAFILGHVNEKSLVIVDELGRGTSTTDGLAIAIAIAEELLRSGATIWFVTHFHELAKYLDKRPGVSNLHLAVDLSKEDQMLMLYTISSGPIQETSYGISLARVACLPSSVIERAQEVASLLRQRKSEFKKDSFAGIQARKQKVLPGLRDQLKWAKESSMENSELSEWLNALQYEFVMRMDELNDAEEQLKGSDARLESTLTEVGSDFTDTETVTGGTDLSASVSHAVTLPYRHRSSATASDVGARGPKKHDSADSRRQRALEQLVSDDTTSDSTSPSQESCSMDGSFVFKRVVKSDFEKAVRDRSARERPPVPLFNSCLSAPELSSLRKDNSHERELTSGHMADDEVSVFEDLLESEYERQGKSISSSPPRLSTGWGIASTQLAPEQSPTFGLQPREGNSDSPQQRKSQNPGPSSSLSVHEIEKGKYQFSENDFEEQTDTLSEYGDEMMQMSV